MAEDTKSLTESELIAETKVRRALECIEAAQWKVSEACQELSPIVGALDDHERLQKLYDEIKLEWHRLNRNRGPFDLDSDAIARLARGK